MAVDYRTLNSNTVPDRHPLPCIDAIFDQLHGSQYFTLLDLYSGYYQVRLKGVEKKTAFLSKWGLYKYTITLLGLINALETFQRLMNLVLRLYLDCFVAVYLDDIIIYSATWDQHLQHVRQVFQLLR